MGEFYLNNGLKNDLIILNKDGTYLHKFTTFRGKVYESSGMWTFERKYFQISLYDLVFYDQNGSTNRPGIVFVTGVSVKRDGEIRIYYSTENRIYYTNKKVNAP